MCACNSNFIFPHMLNQTMAGLFRTRAEADAAVDELIARGVAREDISLLVQETSVGARDGATTADNVAGGAGSGAVTGAAVGGLLGLLVGIGALAIPGIGALFVAGPIAAALGLTGAAATTVSGALTGALAGGLIGALTGLGFSKEDAELYESRIKAGDAFVAVSIRNDVLAEQEVNAIFTKHGADQIRTVG